MQLSQFTDYALRTLILTALNADRRTTIDEVATAYGISKEHVRKVVQQLTRLGFLQATRGRGGGIRLGMPAERIRIAADAFLAELDRHSLADVTVNRAALLRQLAPVA